jgi:hypothetical protein
MADRQTIQWPKERKKGRKKERKKERKERKKERIIQNTTASFFHKKTHLPFQV